jgi:hypothetical protein
MKQQPRFISAQLLEAPGQLNLRQLRCVEIGRALRAGV